MIEFIVAVGALFGAVIGVSFYASKQESHWKVAELQWRAHAFVWGLEGLKGEAVQARLNADEAKRRTEECRLQAIPYRLCLRLTRKARRTLSLLVAAVVLSGCGADFTSTDWSASDTGIEGDAGPVLEGAGGAGNDSDAAALPDAGEKGRGGVGASAGGGVGSGGRAHPAGGAPGAGGSSAGGSVTGSGGAPSTSSGGSGTGGAPLPCGGVGLVTHRTGTGLTWTDCVPEGTRDNAQAARACSTWCAVEGCAGACWEAQFCGVRYVVGQVGLSGSDVVLRGWAWEAPNAGDVVDVDPITQNRCTAVGTWN